MITLKELDAAIECCHKWPPGVGDLIFHDDEDATSIYQASEKLLQDKTCLAEG